MQTLVDFTQSLPAWLQWLAIMAIGATPFLESHIAALVGALAGVPLPLAIAAATAGNLASVLLFILIGDAASRRIANRRVRTPSQRQVRFHRMFDRFGVPGIGLVGQWIVPNQLSSLMMRTLGLSRSRIIVWVAAGILIWGAVFAVLGKLLGSAALGMLGH